MITILPNVGLLDLKPQIVLAMVVVDQVISERTPEGLTITSADDGVHGQASYHPAGDAVDCRTRHLYVGDLLRHEKLLALAAEVRKRLGPEFDVVLEDSGGPNEHLHVEYDRRRARARAGKPAEEV